MDNILRFISRAGVILFIIIINNGVDKNSAILRFVCLCLVVLFLFEPMIDETTQSHGKVTE